MFSRDTIYYIFYKRDILDMEGIEKHKKLGEKVLYRTELKKYFQYFPIWSERCIIWAFLGIGDFHLASFSICYHDVMMTILRIIFTKRGWNKIERSKTHKDRLSARIYRWVNNATEVCTSKYLRATRKYRCPQYCWSRA